MKWLGWCILAIVVGIPALIAGFFVYLWVDKELHTYRWHQTLTVEVETPDGLKTGSSTVRVTNSHERFIPGHPGGLVHSAVRGEAAFVEVAPGRYLFALLKGKTHHGNADTIAQEVFDVLGGPRKKFDVWAAELSRIRDTRTVQGDNTPMLVTFADIDDPESVRMVDPNDLESAFGPGVNLKRITLEITDEPVTSGRVETVLGYFWWPKDKRHAYTCQAYGCGKNPLRINLPNGRYDSLTKLDFASE